MNFNDYMSIEPYSLGREEKRKLLSDRIRELSIHHRQNCDMYHKILDSEGWNDDKLLKVNGKEMSYEDVPFLPVRLFKELELKSVENEEIVKTMTSSGTTGQAVSKIFLDRETSANQQKIMAKIVADFTGSSRMPMIIIDCPSVIKDRRMFSARGAGILGFSIFGKDKCYALLDEDMSLDVDSLSEFLKKHEGEKILLFGFTFMVWQHFYRELERLKEKGIAFDLSNGVLIHGGGWKKLISEAVSHDEFHNRLYEVCGLKNIHDYYGMV